MRKNHKMRNGKHTVGRPAPQVPVPTRGFRLNCFFPANALPPLLGGSCFVHREGVDEEDSSCLAEGERVYRSEEEEEDDDNIMMLRCITSHNVSNYRTSSLL